MNVKLVIDAGGEAAIIENQGDYVVLRSSVPSPPGSTLSMKHVQHHEQDEQDEQAVLVKVRGCKRLESAELPFRIEGRLVSFTRAARERLFAEGGQ